MRGHAGRPRRNGERERQDLGQMPLLGSVGGALWGCLAKAETGLFRSEEQGLVSFTEVLSKGYIRRRERRLLITRAIGEIILGTYIYL